MGCLLRRTVHSDKLTVRRIDTLQGLVNSNCLFLKLGIQSAGDDSRMIRALGVQTNEIPTVDREHGATFRGRPIEDFPVRGRRVSFAPLLNGDDVVTQAAKRLRYGEREILVRIKAGHCQAASLASMSASTSVRWLSTYSHARTRSAALSVG